MNGRNRTQHREDALLVLADGTRFEGEAVGAVPEGGVTTGEAVFNTVLSGYQEVLTDPSYAGQVIAFTYPHIGNYGVNPTDDEAVAAIDVGPADSAVTQARVLMPGEGVLRLVVVVVEVEDPRLAVHRCSRKALAGQPNIDIDFDA